MFHSCKVFHDILVLYHSLVDPSHSARVNLANIRSLQVIEGNLYAWTGSSLYKFHSISIEEQVEVGRRGPVPFSVKINNCSHITSNI